MDRRAPYALGNEKRILVFLVGEDSIPQRHRQVHSTQPGFYCTKRRSALDTGVDEDLSTKSRQKGGITTRFW